MAHSALIHVISDEGNADVTCSAVLDPGKDGHVVKDATRGPHRIVRDEGRMRLWKNWANAGRALGLGPHYTTLIGAFKKNSGPPAVTYVRLSYTSLSLLITGDAKLRKLEDNICSLCEGKNFQSM
ncbi:hypothetical protein ACFX13_012379 [Malus domestica]